MRSTIARHVPRVLLATLCAAVLAAPLHAHEGHDHGAPTAAIVTTTPRAEAASAALELVAVARDGTLTLFLDAFNTNRPVTGATIEVDGPDGTLQPVETAPGTYSATAPFLQRAGTFDLAVIVTAGTLVDVLTATLVIPDPTAANGTTGTFAFGVTPAQAQSRGSTAERKHWPELAWALLGFVAGVAAAFAAIVVRRARPLLVLLALLALAAPVPAKADAKAAAVSSAVRDISQRLPDGSLFVPKPTQRILDLTTVVSARGDYRRAVELPGRLIPDPNGSGLVQAAVGGRLMPPPGGFKPLGTAVAVGDVLAFIRPPVSAADTTSQQQQARELDQQLSIVTRKVERLRAIEKVIARSQLEDAELELKGLHARRANLERANREPEPLVAPVAGILAATNAVAGQMAEPNAVIFQIIDPRRLRVEALSFEPQAIGGKAHGMFADGRSLALSYLGAGLADRNQSVPIHFTVESPPTGLRAGQLLTVLAELSEALPGIALPREAILRGLNGQSIVFEHTGAERFAPREVRVEPLDAERVLVLSGIDPGKRIVTRGAELLNQIR